MSFSLLINNTSLIKLHWLKSQKVRTQNARTSLKSQELKIALFAAAGGENRVVLLCCGNSLPHPRGFVNGFLIFSR